MLYELSRQQARTLKLGISDDWVYKTLGQAEWSPDGRYLLLGYGTSPARGLILVEAASGQVVQEFGTEGGYTWSPESDAVVIGQRRPLDEPISVEPGDAVSLAVLEVGVVEPPRRLADGISPAWRPVLVTVTPTPTPGPTRTLWPTRTPTPSPTPFILTAPATGGTCYAVAVLIEHTADPTVAVEIGLGLLESVKS
jgi:hypothetical protein